MRLLHVDALIKKIIRKLKTVLYVNRKVYIEKKKLLKCKMQSRWETSRRPLFVKTVWANGYHHAVLFNGDSSIDEFKPIHKERRTKSAIIHNDWNLSNVENTNENKYLKISTIRLLLAGIRNFKETKHCHTPSPLTLDDSYTIDVLPKQSIKLKNLNSEISFHPPKPPTKKNKFYGKSCSFDVNDQYNTKIPCHCDEEAINNTLSERVMVWLDLAAQNGDEKLFNNNKTTINQKNKKRGVTAHVCTDIHKKINNKIKASKRISFDESTNYNTKNQTNTDHSILKGLKLDHKIKQTVDNKIEERNKFEVEQQKERTKIKHDTKRQIHIFMPDIPKKIDCDSSLSCKSSSLIKRSLH